MDKFKEYKDKTLYLLPPSLDDFVSEGHLSRVIDEIVEALDTKKIEEKYSHLGQKSYHPKIMLKLLFYGYATGVRSGRKIAQKCETDVSYMYLARMYKPDFRTINDFRKDNLEIIEGYFKDIILLCKELGMAKAGRIIIDSTKIRANASSKRTKDKEGYEEWIKRIDKEIKEIMREAERTDEEEDEIYGEDMRGDELPKEIQKREDLKKKIKEVIKNMEEKERVNLTDCDAKYIKERHGVIRPNYNCKE